MPQVPVRGLDQSTIERLQERAQRHGRSLEGELRTILQAAAEDMEVDARAAAERVQALFAGRRFSDSAELIREDRER